MPHQSTATNARGQQAGQQAGQGGQGRGVGQACLYKRVHRVHVQVVAGLVQQQQVRLGEGDLQEWFASRRGGASNASAVQGDVGAMWERAAPRLANTKQSQPRGLTRRTLDIG